MLHSDKTQRFNKIDYLQWFQNWCEKRNPCFSYAEKMGEVWPTGEHVKASIRESLGKKIKWTDLPLEVQQQAISMVES